MDGGGGGGWRRWWWMEEIVCKNAEKKQYNTYTSFIVLAL